ncbi:MAG: hypothetical protein RLY40_1458 [Pseudomonadota bacterium]|jgi:thiamine kinase-like enzyme
MPRYLISTLELETKRLSEILASIKDQEEKELSLLGKKLLSHLLILKINQPNQFKELTGGFSSDTYHYIKKNLVLRLPKLGNPLVRHTEIELYNIQQAKLFGITAINVIAYFAKYSLLVTSLLPNYQSCSMEEIKRLNQLAAAAHLIKKLHYSEIKFKKNRENAISIIDSSSKTFKVIEPILVENDYKILEKLGKIRFFLSQFKIIKRPSHGDFHHFNLIKLKGVLQLMDWELSSIEDPALDISRFFCVANLDKGEKNFFLQAYRSFFDILLSKEMMESLKTRIQLFNPLNCFSIAVWARYVIPSFLSRDKKEVLEATIRNYTQKTLSTLSHIRLSTIDQNTYCETNATCTHASFFKHDQKEKSVTIQDEYLSESYQTAFKN